MLIGVVVAAVILTINTKVGGAEVKLYARAGQTVLMVGVVQLSYELPTARDRRPSRCPTSTSSRAPWR